MENAQGHEHAGGGGHDLIAVASQWAHGHQVSSSPRAPSPLVALEDRREILSLAHEYFQQQVDEQGELSHAGEWVLDNYYVIQQAFRLVNDDLPEGFYAKLPGLESGDLYGYPRVYALARGIIAYSRGRLDRDLLVSIVSAYQQTAPLKMAEIWALPIMLRVHLLELLSEVLAKELSAQVPQVPALPGDVPEELVSEQAGGTPVARYVPSLHLLGTMDWDQFFDAVSVVEEVLRRDPHGAYGKMEFASRDAYRQVVENLALRAEASELEVAEEALALAQSAVDERPPRRSHVGYYLVDDGREILERRIDYRPSTGARILRALSRIKLALYLSSIALITLAALAGPLAYAWSHGASTWQWIVLALGLLIPACGLAVSVVNLVIMRSHPPSHLPKLDYSDGIPHESRTMIVVPALISDRHDADALLHQMELHYLSSRDLNLGYALLSDFADAPEQARAEDERLIRYAIEGIEALNRKYKREGARPFYLFHRKRLWNEAESTWMGWERKRGKLHEFNRLLRDADDTSHSHVVGDLGFLSEVRYVITLDADTVLPRHSASRLIGTMAHPLNQPVFSEDGKRVVAGYTVLQPRSEIKPAVAHRSLFTDIFSGDVGIDLYTRAVSDPYQDLFGEGIFVGKGIYDVDAFERSLEGRVPENALLSHDLFEGIHGRAGLVTDVLVYEDYPPSYLAYAQRLHRWVRGDWQIIPWLLGRVPAANGRTVESTISWLDRWKIVDNLRRSLHQPAMLLLFAVGWLWLPGRPLVWTLLFLGISGVSALLGVVVALASQLWDARVARSSIAEERQVLRWLLSVVLIPFEAVLMLSAISTTLVRLFISHRRMLQWTTAAHTVRMFGSERRFAATWNRMVGATVLALVLGALMAALRPDALPAAAPLLLVWVLSPQLVVWIARPYPVEEEVLDEKEREELRRLARRTWHFFEAFVGPDDHWLPPDHFQESPRGLAAHRTSPTNIGLLLASTLAAYDLGYIGTMELTLRLDSTLATIEEMERHRGHLLNWYNTLSLEPLEPRYVSTVDSGNLAASLLVVESALAELQRAPVLRWEQAHGLIDTLGVLNEVIDAARQQGASDIVPLADPLQRVRQDVERVHGDPTQWAELIGELAEEIWPEIEDRLRIILEVEGTALGADVLGDLSDWADRVRRHIRNLQDEVRLLLPWVPMLAVAPPALSHSQDADIASHWHDLLQHLPASCALQDLVGACAGADETLENLLDLLHARGKRDGPESFEEAIDWAEGLYRALDTAHRVAQGLIDDAQSLAQLSRRLFDEMDFRFLYDRQRDVFYLGYNVSEEHIDGGHYDLLASEARIASLIAIARGDAPSRHWLHLARPLVEADGLRTLLSWNGSMFEYLMPILYMRSYPGMLLSQTYRGVIARQIEYARGREVPWGISESGYYSFDADHNYQYRGFGVPGLGRKRGLGDDLVITPYASMLALPLRPQAVMQNANHLRDKGLLGVYGFYEAMDYTTSRLPLGRRQALVASYMAHHAGMTLVSMDNYLNDGAIVERFHRVPLIQSVELLLQEQVPTSVPIEEPQEDTAGGERAVEQSVDLHAWAPEVGDPYPAVHYLSNGAIGTLITAVGGGFTRWGDRALTRWRADAALSPWGIFVYLQDRDSGEVWSITRSPVGNAHEHESHFYPHMVEFHARRGVLSGTMQVMVCASDDLEVRRVTLANHGDEPRRLRVVSYAEVIMAEQASDRRHPAFNKLFIESEWLPDRQAQLLSRRARSGDEPALLMAHALLSPQTNRTCAVSAVEHEGDRARFLGRGNTVRHPDALARADAMLSGTEGSTLDPIVSIGQTVELAPHASCTFYYLTTAGDTRQGVIDTLDHHLDEHVLEAVLGGAASQSADELSALGLEVQDLVYYQKLLTALLHPQMGLRAPTETLMANRLGQERLWPHAISGDYPILLVRIERVEDSALVRELLRAHTYWRQRGLLIDLVILNDRESGYAGELDAHLRRLISRSHSDEWMQRRGGVFVLRSDQIGKEEETLLLSAARVVLDAAEGVLAEQHLPRWTRDTPLPTLTSLREPEGGEGMIERPPNLVLDNGYGGFAPDGREYRIYLPPGKHTPAPWVNVAANPKFGFLVSEMGSAFTWAVNSGENRLTPWRNDPVSDEPGEALYLRDEETTEVWSPTPLPAGLDAAFLVRHGAGYSVFEHNSHGLEHRLRLCTSPDDPVKVIGLRLVNRRDRSRRITATYYAAWVLGVTREDTQQYILPSYDGDAHALLARNPYSAEFSQAVAFLASSEPVHGLTCDRVEFLGRGGSRREPAALRRIGLSGAVEAGLDPCAALQIHLDIPARGDVEIYFVLGQGADHEAALELARTYRDPERAAAVWDENQRHWDDILGQVQVDTPDAALNLVLNRWSLYQALSCRVWGRSGFYQSSGAFGFRDQLQDVMALVHTRPDLAREHILRAAAHQFEAGDVLHWWHPPSGRGVRTRISDDLLWLPYVAAEYVSVTGDKEILDEEVPFVRGEPLEEDEEERYGYWQRTEETYSLYEHCRRALEEGNTSGRHQLPLIGTGDWNDGLNHVGREGHGESVWLAWFLAITLDRFVVLAEDRGHVDHAQSYRQRASELRRAANDDAWDGEWYVRAFYDDGHPLGARESAECQIDSLPQSWSLLWRDDGETDSAQRERSYAALDGAIERLVRREHGLVLLFTPPFDETPRDPGYIKGYPPGIRENGGQYTHAATWLTWALAQRGDADLAHALFGYLNPVKRAADPEVIETYRVEPYAVVADIYSVPPHVGRGGWTWYTGSAAWLYRLGLEGLLGLTRRGDKLWLNPCIPASWERYQLSYCFGESAYHILVENPGGATGGISRMVMDGDSLADGYIQLVDDGQQHEVVVWLGG